MNKLLKIIKTIPKDYYTYNDLRKVAELDDASLRVALNRLTKQGELTRLARGIYTVDPTRVDYEKLAGEIYRPSCLSLECVLARAGVLSQIPAHLTLVTSNRSKKIIVGDKEIVYHHLKPEMWWGYEIKDSVMAATPEKALLDLLYLSLNGYATVSDELDCSRLDKNLLIKMAKKCSPKIERVANRLIK